MRHTVANIFRTLLLASTAGLLPSLSWADSMLGTATSPVATGDLLRVSGALVVVLMGIAGLAWMLRRLRYATSVSGRALHVVDRLALGNRESVLLLQVGDEQVLISQTPSGISSLHVLANPVVIQADPPQGSFSDRLKQVLGKGAA